MGVNLLSLLNLIDLAKDEDIRALATLSFTQICADLAPDSAYGGVWSAQARIYERQLFNRSTNHHAPRRAAGYHGRP